MTAWSTQQLADLAGTTVKTVRHYHRLGLLDEPARKPNGYKQYGTAHLVRLLQVKRMSDLGIPLARIRAMASGTDDLDAAIGELDTEFEAAIERLSRMRAELALIRKHRVPLDTPAPFETVAEGLSDDYRGLLTVYSRVFNDEALDDVKELLSDPDDASEPFEMLSDESDDATIEHVAQLLAVSITAHRDRFPWTADPHSATRTKGNLAQEALIPAVAEAFNRGQLRALARAHSITQSRAADPGP